MSQEAPLDKLRRYLVGKTIMAVDPPNADEAICKITTNDGKVWRLHATDLGYWIEDALPVGAKAADLTTLFREYDHHAKGLEGWSGYTPQVAIAGDVVTITALDGKTFEGFIPAMAEYEQKVCRHKEATTVLAAFAQMGDCWGILIAQPGYDGIPEDLVLK